MLFCLTPFRWLGFFYFYFSIFRVCVSWISYIHNSQYRRANRYLSPFFPTIFFLFYNILKFALFFQIVFSSHHFLFVANVLLDFNAVPNLPCNEMNWVDFRKTLTDFSDNDDDAAAAVWCFPNCYLFV